MGDIDWFTVFVLLIIGGVLLWTGVRGWQQLLSMEGPGIRTPKTLASEDAWRRANRAGGGWLAAGGAITVLAGLLHVVAGNSGYASWFTLGGAGGAIVLAIVAYRVAVRAVKDDKPDS